MSSVLRTLVGVKGHISPAESRSGPEVAGDDSVERDKEDSAGLVRRRVAGTVANSTNVVEKPRLDVSLPVAADAPLDQLVPDFQCETIVLPGNHSVDDLQEMSAVDTGVTMSRQRVAVDAQLAIKHLLYQHTA